MKDRSKYILISILTSMGIFMDILPLKYKAFLNTKNGLAVFLQDMIFSLPKDRISLLTAFLAVLVLIFFKSKCGIISKRLKTVCLIISSLFGITQVLSDPVHYGYDLSVIHSSPSSLVRTIWRVLALTYLFYCLLVIFIHRIDMLTANSETLDVKSSKRVFLKVFGSCFAVYAIYYVMFYPGIVSVDAFYQLLQFYKCAQPLSLELTSWKNSGIPYTMTNHHPAFWSYIYGMFSELGNALGDVRIGFAIYNILQMLAVSCTFAFVIYYFYKNNCNRKILKCAAIFYACFPPFALWSFSMVKDSTFFILQILLTLCLHKIVITNGSIFKNVKFCLAFFGLSLLYMLTRNNGVYFIFVIAIVLFIVFRSYYKQILITLLTGIILYQGVYIGIILPKNNIAPAGKQEMFGVFFQQTANYVRMYPDEVTSDEEEAIRKILDYDKLAEAYNPILQDPVKYTYNQDATNEDLLNYAKVWIKQFFKHPISYFQVTFNNIQPFFRLNNETGWAYTHEPREDLMIPEISFNFPQSGFQSAGRYAAIFLLRVYRVIPLVSFCLSLASFTWATLIFIVMLARGKNKKILLAFLPTMLTMLLFLICPVANWRYMMPVVSGLPLLILTLFSNKGECKALPEAVNDKNIEDVKNKENSNG